MTLAFVAAIGLALAYKTKNYKLALVVPTIGLIFLAVTAVLIGYFDRC